MDEFLPQEEGARDQAIRRAITQIVRYEKSGEVIDAAKVRKILREEGQEKPRSEVVEQPFPIDDEDPFAEKPSRS
jgi:ssDNA-binding replication factor A large subunit